MLGYIGKLKYILPPREKRGALRLLILMVLVSIVESLGVSSIMPFVAIVANPTMLQGEGPLAVFYGWTGVADTNTFLRLLGVGVLLVIVLGNLLRGVATWQTHSYTQLCGHAIAVRLFRSYLSRSYEYFISKHSSSLGKNLLHEVHQVVNGVLFPLMSALSRVITAALLMALLLIVDPLMTVIAMGSIGGSYVLIYLFSRRLQLRLGEKSVAANNSRYYVASEIFSGVKDVKLKGLEDVSIERYMDPSLAYARGLALSMTISQTPRFLLEAMALGGVLSMLMYLLTVQGDIATVLPVVSLYVFAGYRLLPALQEIFYSVTRLRFSLPSLDLLFRDLVTAPTAQPRHPTVIPLPFECSIRLENITYKYPQSDRAVLDNVFIEIPRGARVAFVGPTGSGKSTTVDLILGLLRPSSGRIFIDDTPLSSDETLRRWQSVIGYVPQHIFLADDTIAANIAFGQRRDEIDHAAVESAAHMAQLHSFIENDLPEGYRTRVGERGVRLSGGQRQRLGLARALYGNPSVLVLDEATSALDNETETQVMKALQSIGREVTIIAIAHRLSTVSQSDIIFRMEDGRVVASGTPSEILNEK